MKDFASYKSNKKIGNLLLIVPASLLCFISADCCFSQDKSGTQEDIQFIIERSQPLTLDLEKQDSLKVLTHKKKKKPPKNVFYGYKSKRGFTKTGFGDEATVEIFYYLKKKIQPDPYVPEIYWFDFRRKKIRNSGTIDKKYGRILNGPYKKILGEQLLTEGSFYLGTKNGKWVNLDRNDILMDKKKYYHGWPKESLVRYYDEERKKLKEVMPVINGVVQGEYYFFYENGEIAVRGHYENGEKTGRWTEFYPSKRRSKKQIQYSDDPYNKEFIPFTLKEWNESGKLIYDREKVLVDQN
jgi:antitoxin component YwqK of YwqJK toxin-antitoxin module